MMIKIFPNIEELNNLAAEMFVEIANSRIYSDHQMFTVALAGGSTPKSLYQLLAGGKFKNKVDWNKVYFFFGDERNVLPDDEQSNFRMAKESLFEPLKISKSNISGWETQKRDLEKIVKNYEEKLWLGFTLAANPETPATDGEPAPQKWFPRFDLILLGMGADGHTASLFPFTKALLETEKSAVANYVEKLNDWRFTLTFPVINNARNIIFLVAGEEKSEALRDVLEGDFQPEKLPAQNVKPRNGGLFWLLDKNVAKLLRTDGN